MSHTTPRLLAAGIGVGRMGIAAAFLIDPASGLRVLGVDTATAKRAGYVARMLAVRDGLLGVGTLLALSRRHGARGWLASGAIADAVDAAAIMAALRQGQLGGARAKLVAAGAGAIALAGAGAAVVGQR